MRIRAQLHHPGEWTAVDDDTYDGNPRQIGYGKTKEEAIMDLAEKTGLLERISRVFGEIDDGNTDS